MSLSPRPCVHNAPSRLLLAVLFCTATAIVGTSAGGELATGGRASATDPAVAAARAHFDSNGPRIVRDYAELLRLPNYGREPDEIRETAAFIRDAFRNAGITTELLELDDPAIPPLIVGRLDAPGAERTLGIYVHYDGQPAQKELWTHDPFEPVLYTKAMHAGGEVRELPTDGETIDPEWRLYARSASDDKLPIPAILGALAALDEAELPRTSSLLFVFEGEEEIGSTHLGDYFQRYRDRLKVDGWLICDGPSHQSGRPQLVFGVRGVTALEIEVYGAATGLHSGHYGNWAPNPAMMLAQLLASMKDGEGRVLVEGFHDGESRPGPAEAEALAAVPDVDEELRRALGVARSEAQNAPLLERLLTSSLNIRGLWAADVGDRARNVIPSSAIASIDLRLTAGVDPVALVEKVEAHVRRQGYHIVRQAPDHTTRLTHPRIARVERQGGYRAVRTPIDHPFAQQVIRASRRAAGDDLLLMPSLGGSLPLYLFEEILQAPLVVVPFANHDNNQHAPDENLRLGNLAYGTELMAALFTME